MSGLEARSREIVAGAEGKIRPVEFIRTQVREMSEEELVALATAYLYAQVKQRRRAVVREREQAAQTAQDTPQPKEPKWGTKAWHRWAEDPVNKDAADQTLKNRAELERITDAARSRMIKSMTEALDSYRDQMRMEWTEELLESEFALGDGSVTTWGDATKEQHEARMQMHGRNALAGMEGYTRHSAAVDEIERAGAVNLREALLVPAAV